MNGADSVFMMRKQGMRLAPYDDGKFMLDINGRLYETEADWNCGKGKEVFLVPKEGKYLIQFGTGEFLRW